jgi:hypothetical protein
MPKLTKTSLQRSQSVTAKLTVEEEMLLKTAAERESLSPTGYARKVLLSSLRSTPMERLLLAKLCKQETLLLRLFAGLFAQLNEKKTFEREHFKLAAEESDNSQYGKADALLALYASLSRGETEQNGATNHA